MLQITLTFFIITLSIIFSQMKHPLAMGLMLLLQTLLISMLTGLISQTFWFSYILFLVFLGGMLVLFIYVTSLASNEMFTLSMKLTLMSATFLTVIFLAILFMDKSLMMNYYNNLDMELITKLNNFTQENAINLMKLYNYPTNFLTLLLINYLFLTLIVVVKVTNISYGPLRPMA
uniref:NADH-ubiquinone oxidoreductase chain 6 n=1 Tax=Thaumalea sp. ZK-2019 TaxID=2527954 RepID=A0A411NHL4_9DIPT|nr:NADH dehydrogenase subunit 6 [Thaumalea sp. ZK-2019]